MCAGASPHLFVMAVAACQSADGMLQPVSTPAVAESSITDGLRPLL